MERIDYNVSPQEFVRTWQTSETVKGVCQKLKMPSSAVVSRAFNYRKRGIKLKQLLTAVRPQVDVDELNQLIEEIENEEIKPRPQHPKNYSIPPEEFVRIW